MEDRPMTWDELVESLAQERAMLDHLIDEAYLPGGTLPTGVHLVIGREITKDINHDWETPEARKAIRAAIREAMEK